MSNPSPLLEIRDLTVAYGSGQESRLAVRNVSMSINPGQSYGLVGESGSGKTTLSLAVMGYLPPSGQVLSGQILFGGQDLLTLGEKGMRPLWGAQLAMVPQDPLSSLNPSMTIGQQLAEPLALHLSLGDEEVERRSVGLLEMVHIADPERVLERYPHQISGGMQQRVMIAMALSTEPKLLVLDEPTTSLDATTQAEFLDLVRELMVERQTATLYVTHNLGVVAQICQRVAVLYAGELVEDGPTEGIYRKPLFPYTRGLLDSVPRLGENKGRVKLRSIEGRIPDLASLPTGCIFRPRCPLAIEVCKEYPPLYQATADSVTRCHRWQEIQRGEISPRQPEPQAPRREAIGVDATILSAHNLCVHFETRLDVINRMRGRASRPVRAVDGVTVAVEKGRTLGLVGESGSGKTTLARAILGLVRRTDGQIHLQGMELPGSLGERQLSVLRHLQGVFQNPEEALNPFLTVGQTLRYPLVRLMNLTGGQADDRVLSLLESVNLTKEYANRLPGQLSGGEKQRVAVARAFAARPALLLADEPVTSLDVSVQASLLNLLNELQVSHDISYLFISHDLAVVGYLADTVAVIYLGKLMEVAPATELFEPPYHPYTEALLSSIPLIDPRARQERIHLEGEIPSPVDKPSGCPFHTRCHRFLGNICVEQEPPWQETETGTRLYCHIPLEKLSADQPRAFEFSEDGDS
jgi:peptide/nickel transport system ATP-binding protein